MVKPPLPRSRLAEEEIPVMTVDGLAAVLLAEPPIRRRTHPAGPDRPGNCWRRRRCRTPSVSPAMEKLLDVAAEPSIGGGRVGEHRDDAGAGPGDGGDTVRAVVPAEQGERASCAAHRANAGASPWSRRRTPSRFSLSALRSIGTYSNSPPPSGGCSISVTTASAPSKCHPCPPASA